MTSIGDERGFNQGFALTPAQMIRLRRRASAIAAEMSTAREAAAPGLVRVLEIGCGTGELSSELQQLTGAQVLGVDLSERFIARARARHGRPGLDFRVVDLSKSVPELESGSYNFIVGNGILHHLYNQLEQLLPRLKRSLCPDGKLIFWEPNLLNPYIFFIFTIPFLRHVARLEPEEMAFTSKFIKERLESAGFCGVRAVPRDFLLPNTPTLWIDFVVKLGDRLEHCYGIKTLAHSVFLTARNGAK